MNIYIADICLSYPFKLNIMYVDCMLEYICWALKYTHITEYCWTKGQWSQNCSRPWFLPHHESEMWFGITCLQESATPYRSTGQAFVKDRRFPLTPPNTLRPRGAVS